MSQRMTLNEVIREYGVPQIKLDIHAKASECQKLREKLMDIVKLSGANEQTASCTLMWMILTATCQGSWTPWVSCMLSRRILSLTRRTKRL